MILNKFQYSGIMVPMQAQIINASVKYGNKDENIRDKHCKYETQIHSQTPKLSIKF